jgi:hypothetical protein
MRSAPGSSEASPTRTHQEQEVALGVVQKVAEQTDRDAVRG